MELSYITGPGGTTNLNVSLNETLTVHEHGRLQNLRSSRAKYESNGGARSHGALRFWPWPLQWKILNINCINKFNKCLLNPGNILIEKLV